MSGFIELSHTADRALKVWASDLASLFVQAAEGLYQFLEVRKGSGETYTYEFITDGLSDEELLVRFLSELLFYVENRSIMFDTFQITFYGNQLLAKMKGVLDVTISNEIKAVTYHNLKISQCEQGLETVIIFDV